MTYTETIIALRIYISTTLLVSISIIITYITVYARASRHCYLRKEDCCIRRTMNILYYIYFFALALCLICSDIYYISSPTIMIINVLLVASLYLFDLYGSQGGKNIGWVWNVYRKVDVCASDALPVT